MPKKSGDKNVLDLKISAKDLLPDNKAYYRFNGSLTTPLYRRRSMVSSGETDNYFRGTGYCF